MEEPDICTLGLRTPRPTFGDYVSLPTVVRTADPVPVGSSRGSGTVNRELMFLKRVFNLAPRDGKAERNPVRDVKFFKEDNQRVRWLTEEEEARLPWREGQVRG